MDFLVTLWKYYISWFCCRICHYWHIIVILSEHFFYLQYIFVLYFANYIMLCISCLQWIIHRDYQKLLISLYIYLRHRGTRHKEKSKHDRCSWLIGSLRKNKNDTICWVQHFVWGFGDQLPRIGPMKAVFTEYRDPFNYSYINDNWFCFENNVILFLTLGLLWHATTEHLMWHV